MNDLNLPKQDVSPEDSWNNYLRLPYAVAKDLFSPDPTTQQLARLHITLMIKSFFIKGNIRVRGKNRVCQAGECFTSCRKLADMIKVPRTSIHRLLDMLEEKGYIETFPEEAVSKIRLKRYAEWNKEFYRNKNNRKPAPGHTPDLSDLVTPSEEEIERIRRIAAEREKRRNKGKINDKTY